MVHVVAVVVVGASSPAASRPLASQARHAHVGVIIIVVVVVIVDADDEGASHVAWRPRSRGSSAWLSAGNVRTVRRFRTAVQSPWRSRVCNRRGNSGDRNRDRGLHLHVSGIGVDGPARPEARIAPRAERRRQRRARGGRRLTRSGYACCCGVRARQDAHGGRTECCRVQGQHPPRLPPVCRHLVLARRPTKCRADHQSFPTDTTSRRVPEGDWRWLQVRAAAQCHAVRHKGSAITFLTRHGRARELHVARAQLGRHRPRGQPPPPRTVDNAAASHRRDVPDVLGRRHPGAAIVHHAVDRQSDRNRPWDRRAWRRKQRRGPHSDEAQLVRVLGLEGGGLLVVMAVVRAVVRRLAVELEQGQRESCRARDRSGRCAGVRTSPVLAQRVADQRRCAQDHAPHACLRRREWVVAAGTRVVRKPPRRPRLRVPKAHHDHPAGGAARQPHRVRIPRRRQQRIVARRRGPRGHVRVRRRKGWRRHVVHAEHPQRRLQQGQRA